MIFVEIDWKPGPERLARSENKHWAINRGDSQSQRETFDKSNRFAKIRENRRERSSGSFLRAVRRRLMFRSVLRRKDSILS